MITQNIKITLVEDNEAEAFIIKREIGKIIDAPEINHVTSFEEFKSTLLEFRPDIILSDYNLKPYSGFDVLSHVQKLNLFMPFVFVTGTLDDEELAAQTILNGASGFILKKDMNALHQKLKPYFEQIIQGNQKVLIEDEKKEDLKVIQQILSSASGDNEMRLETYNEIKRLIERVKYTVKKSNI